MRRETRRRGSNAGVKPGSCDDKFMIVRLFQINGSPKTTDPATKINRGERIDKRHAGPADGNITPLAIGSKPAKGLKTQECRRPNSRSRTRPDGGPKLRLRRRANGMFVSALRIRPLDVNVFRDCRKASRRKHLPRQEKSRAGCVFGCSMRPGHERPGKRVAERRHERRGDA